MKRKNRLLFRLSLAEASALVLAVGANGLLVLLLLNLSRFQGTDPGQAGHRETGFLEVAPGPVETWSDMQESRPPRPSPRPRKQPQQVPTDPRATPRAPAPPPALRLSLAGTLDVPELPRLWVDPAASLEDLLEDMDLDPFTAPASNPWTDQGPGSTSPCRTDPGQEGNSEPRAVFLPRPRYPGAAVRRNIRSAVVVVHFRVNRNGRVDAVNVVRAEPVGYFEEAVKRALQRARFSPALRRHCPVDRWCSKTYTFVLEDR